jgi:hypothetical protein
MAEPRVWFNRDRDKKRSFRENLRAYSPTPKIGMGVPQGIGAFGDPIGAFKVEAEKESANNDISAAMKAITQAAETKARHQIDMSAPTSNEPSNWVKTLDVVQADDVLHGRMFSDDDIREKLGLRSDFNLELIRTDPNFFQKNPAAAARMEALGIEHLQKQDKQKEENSWWGMDALNWMKDELLDSAVALGEAFDLIWKPGQMMNEKMAKWFPEDAEGTRRLFGNIISHVPLMMNDDGSPRFLTRQEIEREIHEGMADLPIGTEEEREKYKAKVEELKAEGMMGWEASAQAFQAREDIPGAVKFAVPILADPTSYIGAGAFAKTIGKGALNMGKGIKSGMEGARAPFTGGKASKAVNLIVDRPRRIIVDTPQTMGNILHEVKQNPANLAKLPSAILNKVDPSKMLMKLKEGTTEYAVIALKVVGAHGDEQGRRMAEFISQQMEGAHGKIDDLFGKSILKDGKPRASVKQGGKDVEVAFEDVFRKPDDYELTAAQRAYIDDNIGVYEDFAAIAKAEGMPLADRILFEANEALQYSARKIKGQMLLVNNAGLTWAQQNARAIASGQLTKPRIIETMEEGLDLGYTYYNPTETMNMYAQSFYRDLNLHRLKKFADEELVTEGNAGSHMRGMSAREIFPDAFKDKDFAKKLWDDQSRWMEHLTRFMNQEGQMMNPQTVNAMKRAYREIAGDSDVVKATKKEIRDGIDEILRFRQNNWHNGIRAVFDMQADAVPPGLSFEALRDAIKSGRHGSRLRQDITVKEIREALKGINVNRRERDRLIKAISNEMGKQVKKERKGQINKLVGKMNEIVPGSRKMYDKLESDAANLRRQAENPDVRAGEVRSRLFPDRIYKDAKLLEVDQFFMEQGNSFVRAAADVNAALRMFKTTFDLGAPLIQGLPLLFTNAEAWGRATAMHVRALRDPGVRYKYVFDNAEDINEFIKHGMHLGSSEMTEAATKGGLFARLPLMAERAVSAGERSAMNFGVPQGAAEMAGRGARAGGRVATAPIRMAGKSFQNAFETYLDVARIEIMKGLKSTALDYHGGTQRAKALTDLANFANKMTGVTSTKAMGVSVGQRNLEQAILMFSPRYTRATAALFMDMSTGGLRGTRARRAVASLFAGQLMLHAAASQALGQEMNLMPGQGDFLKVRLGDTMVGFGGKPNSFVNMATDLTEQAIDPDQREGFMDWKMWSADTYNSNSFMKRIRWQMAPVGGEALNWITGTDPIGRSLPDFEDLTSDPKKALEYSGQKVFPFWLDAVYEGGHFDFAAQASIGEFGGAAVNPVLPQIHLQELRDKLVSKEYGDEGIHTFDDMKKQATFASKNALLLQTYPELKAAEEKYRDTQSKFENNKQRIMYQEGQSNIRQQMIEGIVELREGQPVVTQKGFRQVAAEFESGAHGRRAGMMLRQGIRDAQDIADGRRKDLRKRFPQLVEDNKEYWQGDGQTNETIAATNEFFDFLSSNRSRDTFGNVNHLAIAREKDRLENKYGEEVADEMRDNYVRKLTQTPDGVTMPEVVLAYYESWDTLEPYWNVYKKALPENQWNDWEVYQNANEGQKMILKQNYKYGYMEEKVQYHQERMRRLDYDIDKALTVFYDLAPVNARREREIQMLGREMRY